VTLLSTFETSNKIMQKDRYPIPLVTILLNQLGSAKVYTSSTSVLATTMFTLQQAMSGRQLSRVVFGFPKPYSITRVIAEV